MVTQIIVVTTTIESTGKLVCILTSYSITGAYAARLLPCYCIIMEYCRQGALYDVLRYKDHNILPPQVVGWSRQIASGMQFLHSHPIIHRDLKSPKYVMFTCKTPDSLSVKYLWFKPSADTAWLLLINKSSIHLMHYKLLRGR